jgi:hypothetical protein
MIAGPPALVATILAWIGGLVVGFALLYFHSFQGVRPPSPD